MLSKNGNSNEMVLYVNSRRCPLYFDLCTLAILPMYIQLMNLYCVNIVYILASTCTCIWFLRKTGAHFITTNSVYVFYMIMLCINVYNSCWISYRYVTKSSTCVRVQLTERWVLRFFSYKLWRILNSDSIKTGKNAYKSPYDLHSTCIYLYI